MKTIKVGNFSTGQKFGFRETCFGIVVDDSKFLIVRKNGEPSLIGGGIKNGETHMECLKREFLEESGFSITSATEFETIDCFWLTNTNYPLESLAHIYTIKVDLENVAEPSETGFTSEWVNADEIVNILPLPYQKEAIRLYLDNQA